MNSKQRVMTAISHAETDRVPLQIYLTPEVQQDLLDHFGLSDVLALYEVLGVDLRGVHPVWTGELPPVPEGCDMVDEWGAGYTRFDHGTGGAYFEATHLALAAIETMDDVANYPWPDPNDYDCSTIEAQCDAFADYAVCAGDPGTPDILNGVSRGRGMERVVMDVAMGDPVGTAIVDRRCDYYFEKTRRVLEAGNGKIDILCIGEDTGSQRGPMFSPQIFDRFFRPRLQRFIDLAHDFGCKAMMHSCGDTSRLQERFIEMGLDVLDAMQPEPDGMVVEEIKARCAGRLALCGLISTQHTLPFGTAEECRAEARDRIDVVGRGGGYILSPAHCIQANTPIENILAIYEEARGLEPGGLANMRRT